MSDRQAAVRALVQARLATRKVRGKLPAPGQGLLDAALTGTADPQDIIATLPRAVLPAVAVGMAIAGVRPDVLAPVWRWAWLTESATLRREAKAHKVPVLDVFRRCAFPIPSDLPDVVTVYRGTIGIPRELAIRGLSWTTDAGGACWWATGMLEERGHAPQAYSLVVTRTVERRQLVFYEPASSKLQNMDELLFDAPPAGEVFADRETWENHGAYWEAKILQRAGWAA